MQIIKQRGADKIARIPIKIERPEGPPQDAHLKPRIKLNNDPSIARLKSMLRQNRLVTVCEEASCPNLSECFSQGTATFMILGDKCTRRCAFCDVAHGRPDPIDPQESENLAKTIQAMALNYVVITSVDRDDLRDGGAQHFADCIRSIRQHCPKIKIEILVPDFRGRMQKALELLIGQPPDVFNHNIETVPRLYKQARSGADYIGSLKLLLAFKEMQSTIPTKSGLMLGLGENMDEIKAVLNDLRQYQVDMLTLGQYLAPSTHHFPVMRYYSVEEFKMLAQYAYSIGFKRVASGPLVRSSYHADKQNSGEHVT